MEYPLPVVLTVTTGRLLCRFGDAHQLLEHLAGEPVFTHALPRVSDEATPGILARYPALADIEVPEFGDDNVEELIGKWLDGLYADGYPRTLDIDPMAPADHTSIDPFSELAMRGVPADRIIPIVVDP